MSDAVQSRVRSFDAVSVGDALDPVTVHVDRARLVEYAAASGDRNPIHWDDRFATAVGLPDVIAHGMFTMGAASQVLSAWAGDAGAVLDYGCKFVAPVVVPHDGGADIEVSGVVKKLDEQTRRAVVELTVTSGGTKVLGRPLATVQLG